MPAPAAPGDVLHGCHYLRTVSGLPCHIDEHSRLAVLVGGNVGALIMSEYWGHCVKDRLSGFGMVGPIVWHPFNQLTVITGLYDPAHLDQRRVSEVLRETDSVLIEPGQVLTLPTPGDSSRGWETPPRNSFRPAMSSVLAALVACVDQRRR